MQPLLEGDPAAVPVLIELLDHEDEGVRVTATQGLRAVGPAARDATLALARGLSDTEEVQEKSFQALAAIGSGAEAAVLALKAIIRAGPSRGPAFDGYAAHDSYTAKWPRIAAARVLWCIAPEEEDILLTLLHALNDWEEADKRLQTEAIKGLGDIGPRAKVAVPRLLEVIKTDDNGYRVEVAAEALKKIDPEAAAQVGVK
jgi:HEAT repeat protein